MGLSFVLGILANLSIGAQCPRILRAHLGVFLADITTRVVELRTVAVVVGSGHEWTHSRAGPPSFAGNRFFLPFNIGCFSWAAISSTYDVSSAFEQLSLFLDSSSVVFHQCENGGVCSCEPGLFVLTATRVGGGVLFPPSFGIFEYPGAVRGVILR